MKNLFNQTVVLTNPVYLALIALAVVIVVVLAATSLTKNKKLEGLKPPPSGGGKQTSTSLGGSFDLNIVGVPTGKTVGATSGQIQRVFISLDKPCKLIASDGDFKVVKANCLEGPADFQLPNTDNTGITKYAVWARVLGRPGAKSKATACMVDPTTKDTYCSVYSMVFARGKDASFSDVAKLVLSVYADPDGDGTLDRYTIFDSALENYMWQTDSQGFRLAQLRFMTVASGQ